MIVSRGLGRPSFGGLVAFGLGQSLALPTVLQTAEQFALALRRASSATARRALFEAGVEAYGAAVDLYATAIMIDHGESSRAVIRRSDRRVMARAPGVGAISAGGSHATSASRCSLSAKASSDAEAAMGRPAGSVART